MNIRVVKGYTTAVTLPGLTATSAVLEFNGDAVELEVGGGAVIIRAEQIRGVPVPKRAGAVYECVMVLNGDTRIPCYVVANPLRPRL